MARTHIARATPPDLRRAVDWPTCLGRAVLVKSIKMFAADEAGATAIEYALIASLIAVFIIGALQVLGTSISSEFTEVGTALK
jgi:pilus assembly protein Flp/PilA